MKIPHPALGKKFCTSGEFRLAKNRLLLGCIIRKGIIEDRDAGPEKMTG